MRSASVSFTWGHPMAATTYDTSQLYPYYENAAREMLRRKQLAFLHGQRSQYPISFEGYKPDTPRSDIFYQFGDFPLLIVCLPWEPLFWKQIAHALGATYADFDFILGLIHLIVDPEHFYGKTTKKSCTDISFDDILLERACVELLAKRDPLNPLFCILPGTPQNEKAYFAYKSTMLRLGTGDVYGSAIVKNFIEKLNSSGGFPCSYWDLTRSPKENNVFCKYMYQLFGVPSIQIYTDSSVVTQENIAERERYTAYFEAICATLRAIVDFLRQKDVVTLPLSVPANYQDIIRQLQATSASQTQVTAAPDPLLQLPPAVQSLLTSGKIPRTPQVQAPPAPSVSPVPAPADLLSEIEREIQQRLSR